MEEETTPVQEGETPAPSASETPSTPEVDPSPADTSVQPTEEVTSKPSRVQERISQLAQERSYWKDLATQKQETEPQPEDTGEVTVAEVARQTAEAVRKEMRQEEAHRQAMADAVKAEQKYPQLSEDEDLATDVIALARGRNISILDAAEKIIGRSQAQAEKVNQAKGKAEASLKAPASVAGKKVASGDAAPIDLSQLSEEDKAANWNQIISNIANQE